MNAINIDEENKNIPNLVIVSRQNELNANSTAEEFVWAAKEKERRISIIAADNV